MCRVLDYSKYKYEQAQKLKQARKHQQQITVREIKFRPKIAQHDYDTKKGHVERFLRHKDKVKVTIMFRGREVTHPERGIAILDRLAEELSELGVVEQRPMQEGRNMTMMMAPSKAVLAGKASVDAVPQTRCPGRRRCGRRGRATALDVAARRATMEPQQPREQSTDGAAVTPSAARRRAKGESAAENGRSTPPTAAAPSSTQGRQPAIAGRPVRGRRAAPCHNRQLAMPKMKTHSGAKKRFKVTATGKVRGRHAFTSHILEKKSPKHKRQLGEPAILAREDVPRVKRMLGVGK